MTAQDDTAGLQTAGGSGLYAYLSSTATAPVEWLFDEFRVVPGETPGSAPPPAPAILEDAFDRTAASSWGAADVGGTWALSGGTAGYSVNGSEGVFSLEPGKSRRATLSDAPTDAADLVVKVGSDEAVLGSGIYLSVLPRYLSDGSAYRAKVFVRSDATATLSLTRVDASGRETVIANASRLVGVAGSAQESRVLIRVQAVGTSPTELRAKAWLDGQEEPADWALTATDDTAALQQPGGAGLYAYQSSSATRPLSLLFDDFVVRELP